MMLFANSRLADRRPRPSASHSAAAASRLPGLVTRPLADHLVDPTRHAFRSPGHRFEGNVPDLVAHVQAGDPLDTIEVEWGEPEMAVTEPVRLHDDRRKVGSGLGIGDQADHQDGPGPDPALGLAQGARGVLAGHIEVVQDHQGRQGGIQGFPYRRQRQRCGGSAGPRVVNATAVPADLRGEFRGQPGLADLGGPGNEDDPAVSPAGLAPCTAKPMHLEHPVDQRRDRVELRRKRPGPANRDCLGLWSRSRSRRRHR